MPSGEDLLVAQVCGFAGSGGFGFRVLDFGFVWDFEFPISNFLIGCGRRPRYGFAFLPFLLAGRGGVLSESKSAINRYFSIDWKATYTCLHLGS